MTRPPSDTQRLLTALSDGRPHASSDLYRLGLMVHSRVSNLRSRGYTVECWRYDGEYWYRLVARPEPVAA